MTSFLNVTAALAKFESTFHGKTGSKFGVRVCERMSVREAVCMYVRVSEALCEFIIYEFMHPCERVWCVTGIQGTGDTK